MRFQVEKGMLYPFQEEAVARLGRKALLADDPGLGKTRTALAAACRWSAFPLLVVSPLSVIGFWEEEAERVLGVRPVRIRTAADGPAALERGIGVINPERLKEVLDFPFRGLILDESHLYKNPLARLSNGQWVYVTQRVRHAAELARRAEFVWLLSATPDPNGSPMELVPQLEMIGAIWLFGRRGRRDFLERHGVLETLEVRGRRIARYTRWRNREEALRILERAGFYLRREKREVATWLPEIIRQALPVTMDPETWKEYVRTRDRIVERWRTALMALPDRERRLALMRRMLALPAVSIGQMRRLTERFKASLAEEIAAIFPKPAVWFVAHPEHAREVARRLGGMALVGETPVSERARMVADFRSGKIPHLAISIRAGGLGISLENAAGAVFIGMDWSPGAIQQAEERIHRINRTIGPPLIWRVIATGPDGQRTIDHYVENVLRKKGWSVEEAILDILENLMEEAQ